MSTTLAGRAVSRPESRPESHPASARYHVETLEDLDSVLQLESTWNELLEQSGISNPFLTHEWVRTWLEHFGDAQRIHVLLVKSGDTVVGIVPLMLQQTWSYGMPVRRLQSIHNVYTERFDFIINGPPEEIYPTIWNHLLTRSPHWDVLELRQVPANSPTLAHLTRLAHEDRHPTERWHSCDAPYIAVEGAWDNYHAALARKLRANLRNRLGRLSKLGTVEVEVIDSADRIDAALAEAWVLEAAAWKGEAGTAVGGLASVRDFYEKFATRAARRGWLRLYFLTIDGRRIAFCYGLTFRNRTFDLKIGYDPQYAAYSPSMVLRSMLTEEAFRDGRKEIHLLGVNDDWKRSLTATTQPHEWLYVFRRGLRPQLLHWAKFRVAPVVRRALGPA